MRTSRIHLAGSITRLGAVVRSRFALVVLAGGLQVAPAVAASSVQMLPVEDAFVTNGTLNGASATANFGILGALMVAGDSSGNGTFETLLKFNLSAAVSQFNTDYGIGNWSISAVSLRLASNVGVQDAQSNNLLFPAVNGGAYGIAWLQDDSWTETGITYNTLSGFVGVQENLGAQSYLPPGNNVQQTAVLALAGSMVADAASGGMVSLLLSPADNNVSFLMNSRSYNTAANRPLLTVTASAIPEPATWLPCLLGAAVLGGLRRRNLP